MMSEFAEGTVHQPFWKDFPDVSGYFEKRLPTLDRSLDKYFDQNFEAIIEEWELLRGDDLIEIERRLNRVTEDVTRLCRGKGAITGRVEELETMIAALERSIR